MHRADDGTIIVSATDLVSYLACDHLATLELGRAEGRGERPHRREDLMVQLMQDRGDEHEQAHLERLRARGLRIVEIDKDGLTTPDRLRAAEAATVAAMRDGADVIFQATFFDGRWRGHADFLYRVERPSPALGSWSYDIADTKLSRGVKGSAILQMCVYADLLERLQGIPPETIHVVTGDGVEHAHRLADYAAYYRHAKDRFEARVLSGSDAVDTYPDPVEHCHVCVWYPDCLTRRRDDDHPSIVAGMRRVDTERLLGGGVPTLAALAALPADREVTDVPRRTLDRLRHQARLQLEERETGRRKYELIEPDPESPGRGLAALPLPDPADVFLDIEADPWALDGGLEYLHGLATLVDHDEAYLPLWAHDRAEERSAFEAVIDLVIDRLDAHPGMHLYHYGGYESGAMKRLMQRHATREDEVDRLLRGGVLVDLLNVVRGGIRASVESYSLKQIEKFYMPRREGPVTEAGFSVVEYERWKREADPSILAAIADYNRDDCVSTLRLRDWLEARRVEAVAAFPDHAWNRPVSQDGEASAALTERRALLAARMTALTAGIPADPLERSADQAARWLLAQLLDWHWRDEKPAWWAWHHLRTLSMENLIRDNEGIGGLVFVEDVEWRKQSVVRRYRFEPQDHKFRPGEKVVDPSAEHGDFGEAAGEVVAVDDVLSTIDLLRGPKRQGYHPAALIPAKPFGAGPMPDALGQVADHVLAHGMHGAGPYRAARDLLLRLPPRVIGTPEWAPLRGLDEPVVDAARRIALTLDETILPIQGPPGTGKTYTGARMIVALIQAGKRVGISAQSHKAITNLLAEVLKAAAADGLAVRAIQKCGTGDGLVADAVTVTDDNGEVDRAISRREVDIVAGTSWLFARDELDGRIDTLFVDEAGQMSLAIVIAMSGAAPSIVLLGDPNQLPQVSQGVHPEGSGVSGLEHLLGGATTVDDRLGLFLDTTWRMHPSVTDYISTTFYDGRLLAHPMTAVQRIDVDDPVLGGAGIRFVAIEHTGNDSDSHEEAAAVADMVERLIGRPWTDQHGAVRAITEHDILVVAPYNAQVALVAAAIKRRVGARVRVGTVDKFQGQEGAIAIYTMTSSSRDDAPRDLEFLYSRNRLNVAVSRARSVAVVVASPALLDATCRTPDQIRLLNALCRLVEIARD